MARRASKTQPVVLEVEGADELIAALRAVTDAPDKVLEQATLAGGAVIERLAEQKAPGPHIDTEVEKKAPGAVTVAIGPDKDHWYYLFFETGAQSHEVLPKNRQVLKWPGAEGDVFVERVLAHPGMPAQPFMRPAADTGGDAAAGAVGDVIAKEISKHEEQPG